MTREERLFAMRMVDLVEVAEAEGIKIDRKGSKAKAVEKILAAEAAHAEAAPEEAEAIVEPSQTEEPESEVCSEEIANADTEAKEEARKPRKRQAKENPMRDKIIAEIDRLIAENGYIRTTYEKVGPNFVVLRTEAKAKVKYEFYYGRKEVKINMKPVDAEALGLAFTEIQKYYLPAVVRIAYTDSDAPIQTIGAILAHK